MLLIDTYLDKSPIHGLGVFAAEDVSKGTIVWEFNPIFDSVIRKDEIADLPRHALEYLFIYAWQNTDGDFCIGIDNDKYANHSPDPNSRYLKESNTWVAVRDIKKGEELTDNYIEFSESDYAKSLETGEEYDPSGRVDDLINAIKNSE